MNQFGDELKNAIATYILHYVDAEMEWVSEKEAKKLWEWLFENREKTTVSSRKSINYY